MLPAAATAAKVTGVPARSSSRSAWMALAGVSSCRRAAAMVSGVWVSGRIGGCFVLFAVGFEGGDDLFEVGGDVLVHLGEAGLPVCFGSGDELHGGMVLGAVPGQELGGCEEHRACETRVGVRAGSPDREPAVAVWEGLGCPAEPLLGPGGIGEWPARVEGDGFAAGVDLVRPFPVLAHRAVVQPGVMRGHGRGVMIEDLADDFLRHVPVETGREQCSNPAE